MRNPFLPTIRSFLHILFLKVWAQWYIASSIIVLGIPIVVGQLGAIAQQFADTIMVGQYGTVELAAAGFVNNVFNFVIYLLLGISYGSTPVIGALFGKNDKAGVAQSLRESILVNFCVSLVVVGLLLLLWFNIEIMHQPEEIIPLVKPYFLVLTLSLPFMAVFNALKQFSEAIGETRLPMWIMIVSNVLNIVLNWLLIFGLCGFPEMGLLGAGIATLAARIFCLVALAVCICFCKRYSLFVKSDDNSETIDTHCITAVGVKHLLLLGLPISVQLGLEASSFNVCAIFMGWLGAVPLAAHQIMGTISTLCFQMLYGIGASASILVSQYCGVGDMYNVRRTAFTAYGIGIVSVICMMTVIFLLRYPIISAFTDNEDVIAVVLTLVPCFMIYQFGDCTQIIFANALRGVKAVKKMMLFAFIAYVLVSIPLSYFFAFITDLGAMGVWLGVPFGLTTAGVLFFLEFRKYTNAQSLVS